MMSIQNKRILIPAARVDEVRGPSSIQPNASLEPVELTSGDFMLPLRILDAPAHADKRELLESFDVVDASEIEVKTDPDDEGDTV